WSFGWAAANLERSEGWDGLPAGCERYLRPGVELHWARFIEGVGAIAAPLPIFRFLDQTASHWISMDVFELLDPFVLGPDVVVVVAACPEVVGCPILSPPRRTKGGIKFTDLTRTVLLQDLHCDCE